MFPWVAADANGHVAVAWYGADVAGNSNTVQAATTHWNVYVAETVNGHVRMPVFTQSLATDHVNHTGQISTGGLLGSSDRSLADFFQIAVDPTNHLVNVAYADNHAGPSDDVAHTVTIAGVRHQQRIAGSVHDRCCG